MSAGAPVIDFGGSGPLLHFLHANGFAPAVYSRLLSALSQSHHVLAIEQRPLWRPPLAPDSMRNWDVLVDDLLATLRTSTDDAPVIAVGHSLGAFVSLMAACQQPQRFTALVLIEPPFLPLHYHWAFALLRRWSQQHVPMISATLRRRDHWRSEAAVFAHFRRKAVFTRWPDAALHDYVRHGTEPAADGGRRLRYDKHWEARIYTTLGSHWRWLRRCSVPVLALRGAESDTLSRAVWQRWQQLVPQHHFVEVPHSGHLLPLELPDVVAAELRHWLSKLP